MSLRAAPETTTALDVHTVTTLDELEGLRDEWVSLLARTQNDLPFLQPEWESCWWSVFRQDGRLLSDALRVKTVRARGGRLVGVLPLMLTQRPNFGPLRVRTLTFLGADQFISELRAPIVDPSCEVEVGRSLASH